MQLQFSIFNSIRDNNVSPLAIEWSELVDFCRQPKELASKHDNSLFSPATYSTANRVEKGVIEVCALVLDIDHDASLHDTWGFVREWGNAALVYTSYRHQNPDEGEKPEDKFRIILPLATPCPASVFPALWQWVNAELGGIVDPACKNANRIFYWPAKASVDAPYFTAHVEGEALDWTTLLLPLTDEQEMELPPQPKMQPPPNWQSGQRDAGALALLKNWSERVANARNGEKWLMIRDGAYCLGGLVGAGRLDGGEVEAMLYGAVQQAGAKDLKHALRTIQQAIARGAASPLYAKEFSPTTQTQFPMQAVEPEIIKNAEGVEVLDGYHMEWLEDDIDGTYEWLQEDNKTSGVTTGFGDFDKLFRPRKPALTVVVGQPNAGKSNWLDALAVSIAQAEQWKFAVVSFETQPIRMHRAMLTGFIVQKYYRALTKQDLRDGAKVLGRNFAFHLIPPKFRTPAGVLKNLSETCANHHIDSVIFDPFTELDLTAQQESKREAQQTAVIGSALTNMKSFAYERLLHFFLVVHPSKNSDRNTRQQVLTLEDGSGSKHFENKADYGLTVHREIGERDGVPYDKTSVHVTKVRRGYPGRKGCQYFDYQSPVGDYREGEPLPPKRGGKRGQGGYSEDFDL